MTAMIEALRQFATDRRFAGKGPLCVALVVTDHARRRGLPLDADELVTPREGQVLGLGRSAVQAILARSGITKILAAEGGRTSRGSLGNMRDYIRFLNDRHKLGGVDLGVAEAFWIDRVRDFFAAKPLVLRLDPALSISAVMRSLTDQAEARQRAASGTMILGTVMQHLVGAKLQVVLAGRCVVEHNGANTNDANARGGDFDIGDASIHVTTAPGQGVIDRCRLNLDSGRKPIIVTSRGRVAVAQGLAEDAGIASRIEIIEFEQFMAANIHEHGGFEAGGRSAALGDVVAAYNAIIDAFETDPGLRIDLILRR